MANRKCNVLPLKRKIDLIEQVESGKKQKIAAEDFGISANTVSVIMKNKDRYREQFYSGQSNVDMKRARQAQHGDVETELLKWFCAMRGNNVPLSGPIMKTKATAIARNLGKMDWECNDGWLSRFKTRHNIVFKNVCGESESVDTANLDQWTESVLRKKIRQYRPCDVFNADETGLFWRMLPDKTMAFRGQACHGTKTSKDRITVLTCANMDGSCKWPLFVIGKFKVPRCFKGLKKIPVRYEANTKAWMTAATFTSWLEEFDKKMHMSGRKVLLVVDNCTAHPKVDSLKATELLFLPPNTTSKSQPCDMGIINNIKCHYRTALLKKLIDHVDAGNSFDSFKPTLLDAVKILKQSWERVEPATIQNCFKRAGFTSSTNENESTTSVEPILEQLFVEYGVTAPLTVTGIDMVAVDEGIETAPSLSETDSNQDQAEVDNEETAEVEDDQGEQLPVVTEGEFANALTVMETYFMQKGYSDDALLKVRATVQDEKEKAKRQTTITSFFSTK